MLKESIVSSQGEYTREQAISISDCNDDQSELQNRKSFNKSFKSVTGKTVKFQSENESLGDTEGN